MNLLEELQSLDPRDPGRWPLAIRAGAVGICFLVLTMVGIYFFVWDAQRPELQRSRPEIVHVFDEIVRTLPDGVYLTAVKQTDTK